jgi:hypothetical protein
VNAVKVTSFMPTTKPGVLIEMSYEEADELVQAVLGVTGVDSFVEAVCDVLDEIDSKNEPQKTGGYPPDNEPPF